MQGVVDWLWARKVVIFVSVLEVIAAWLLLLGFVVLAGFYAVVALVIYAMLSSPHGLLRPLLR